MTYYLKVHIRVKRLSQLSFPLSWFVIERFHLRAQGKFSHILCSDQPLASVVWLLSKVRRILWSSVESLKNVFPWKRRLWGSSQPQSLFSIIIIRGDSRPYIYTTATLKCKMCMLERGQILQEYSRGRFDPGVGVPLDPHADSSTFTLCPDAHKHKEYSALSALHFSLVR